ncbi:MAG: hypothetical protein AAGF15_10155 [Pseudomonadota bacterium]
MAFEYGSQQLDVRNPFRLEGLLLLVRGVITLAIGGLMIFSIRENMGSGAAPEAYFVLAAGLVFIGLSLKLIVNGLMRLFRFFVGRNVPADLTAHFGMTPETLTDMMRSRTNRYFVEPKGLVAWGVHSAFPQLLRMPWPYRNLTVKYVSAVFLTGVIIALYFLAQFSATSGLIALSAPEIMRWIGLGTAIWLAAIWVRAIPKAKQFAPKEVASTKQSGLVLAIAFAILAPYGFGFLDAQVVEITGEPFPKLPFDPTRWIVAIAFGAVIIGGLSIFMLILRGQDGAGLTEVSEDLREFEGQGNPKDLFSEFDRFMEERRFLDIPNRRYGYMAPDIQQEGERGHGRFTTQQLWEVQPAPVAAKTPELLKLATLVTGLVSHTILILATILVYRAVTKVSFADPLSATAFVLPIIFWVFGLLGAWLARYYWAELQFESTIIYFGIKGNYQVADRGSIQGYQGGLQERITVYQFTAHPRMYIARLRSSTFAASGANNLEQPRYVLDMRKQDQLMAELGERIRTYLGEKRTIHGISSTKDQEALMRTQALNNAMKGDAPAVLPTGETVAFDPKKLENMTPEQAEQIAKIMNTGVNDPSDNR